MTRDFLLETKGDVAYLTIPSFTATGLVAHAFTTRRGGVGRAPYHNFNLGSHVGDDPDVVAVNRSIACKLLGADANYLVAVQQVHGHQVITVDHDWLSQDQTKVEADALVTAERNILLSSYYADCVPLFFLDPIRRVIALAHAGWRGSVAGIGVKTVKHMEIYHGCKAKDILVGVGPAIGVCCYEVDTPVLKALQNCLKDLPDSVNRTTIYQPTRPGHARLNLPVLNYHLLLAAGILKQHLTVASYCTSCRHDLFFSHRAEHGQTGRMASLIMLKGGDGGN